MLKKFFNDPFFQTVKEDKKKNFSAFSALFLFNAFASLLEGGSFTFIILALSSLDQGSTFEKVKNYSIFFTNINEWDKMFIFSLLIIIAILMQILRSSLGYFGYLFSVKLSTNIQTRLQSSIYRQIFRLSFSNVSKYKTGDLIEYATSPSTNLPDLSAAVNESIVSFFTCIVLFSLLIGISTKLTFIVLITFSVVFFLQKKIIKIISKISRKLINLQTEFSKKTVQNLHAIRLIFTYNRKDSSLKRTNINIKNISKATFKQSTIAYLLTPLNEIMSILLVGICLIVGPFFLKDNSVSYLLTFLTITYRLSTKFQILSTNIGKIAKGSGFIKRMNSILDNKDKEIIKENEITIVDFNQQIEFDNVFFRYDNILENSIKNMSFKICKGQTVAFVGPSGAGKSTILDLFTCLYEPNIGRILIDKVNLSTVNRKSWRELLGVVSQDVFIFHGSIADNVRFGKLNASNEEIIQASKTSGAYEFISNLPKGFNTVVGERGYRLSGGEKQRLALTRALIRKPKILILDEATSNLDSKSELYIQKALNLLQHTITIIIVAHRLSTITKADEIFFIENGQLIEKGIHNELLKLNGRYASFWDIQSNKKTLIN
jgi:ATP-binding cassette, subfamily B, bacterial MsbA